MSKFTLVVEFKPHFLPYDVSLRSKYTQCDVGTVDTHCIEG
jgi:hypothetical protein